MEKLKITVNIKNTFYAEALARGLCMENSGIEVVIYAGEDIDIKSCQGIVITDRETVTKQNSDGILYMWDIKKLPVKAIMELVSKAYFLKTGKIFEANTKNSPKVWEFFSYMGGAGTTSITLTAARTLAMNEENRVFYMNLTAKDDYRLYFDFADEAKPKKQLIYNLTREKISSGNRPVDIKDYVIRDTFGVESFLPQERNDFSEGESEIKEAVMELLIKSKRYSHIILDSHGKEYGGAVKIEVVDNRDSRCKVTGRTGDVVIENYRRSKKNEDSDGECRVFNISEDKESFEMRNEIIEISMIGAFAGKVNEVVLALSKFVEEKQLQ